MHKLTVNSVKYMCSKKIMMQVLLTMFFCVFIHVCFLRYVFYFADNFNIIMTVAKGKTFIDQYPKNSTFILVWNKYNNILKKFGIKDVLHYNCSRSDCVFTENRNLLYDYIRYDAIIFNEFVLNSDDRPNRRTKFQLFIFSSQKSSYDAPACDPRNDNFFNLTFTHRLDSDVLWSYIIVRNLSGAVVAPQVSINWKNSVKPVSKNIKSFLMQKRKAVVWLINEKPNESNVEYLTRLKEHLFHYSLKIDIYGNPPLSRCPKNDCTKTIRDKYYFYIAFENSFSTDYVSDVVLDAYNNYAVPVVYGGANYSRFLPPGSYINARNIHPYHLAHVMNNAIKDPVLYEAYFRWRNIYTIHDNSKSHASLCELCETIHSYKSRADEKLPQKQFRRWWNELKGMKRCLSEAYWKENANLNINHILNLI